MRKRNRYQHLQFSSHAVSGRNSLKGAAQTLTALAAISFTTAVMYAQNARYNTVPSQIAPTTRVAKPQKNQTPVMTVDALQLLADNQVFSNSLSDPLWSFTPSEGYRYIKLPVQFNPAESDTKLSSPPIKLRSSRFVCWYISPKETQYRDTGYEYYQDEYQQPAYRETSFPGFSNQADSESDQDTKELTTLPDGAPRVTRKIVLHPDGGISWGLDRGMPTATLSQGNQSIFVYKINPKLLRERMPEKPSRSSTPRNELQQAYENYKLAVSEYKLFSRQVRELTSEFTDAMPGQVYAVFEIAESQPNFVLSGIGFDSWATKFSDFERMKQAASGGSSSELSLEQYQLISDMTNMIRDKHPVDYALVAKTLCDSQMIGKAKPDGPLYRLIAKLLDETQGETRTTVVRGLSETVPPTAASLGLLQSAAKNLGPLEKLLTLRSVLHLKTSDPLSLQRVLQTVNETLTDPTGPEADLILDEVVQSLKDDQEVRQLVIAGIKFEKLNNQRLDQAIKYIIAHAYEEPVIEGWLNHRLLGSSDPAVIIRTLQVIASSNKIGESGVLTSVTQNLMSKFLGKTPDSPEDELNKDKFKIRQPIPIKNDSHAIFRSLRSGDPVMRKFAWQSLKHFTLKPESRSSSDTQLDLYYLLMTAALEQQDTPDGVAAFFARQDDTQKATEILVNLVVKADDQSSLEAGMKLRRSGRSFASYLERLSEFEREEFGRRLYQQQTNTQPAVVGLLRATEGSKSIIRWFANELSSTGLPDPSLWATEFTSEDELLKLAGSTDVAMARGAVGALVASAGGDDMMQKFISERVAALPDRSESALRDYWGTAKREIYTRSLESSAGIYDVELTIYGEDPALRTRANTNTSIYNGGADEFDYDEEYSDIPRLSTITKKIIRIGQVELLVEPGMVRFAGEVISVEVPEEYLALRVRNLADLKNFALPELMSLPLSQTKEALDLRLQANSKWFGKATLEDGREVELRLLPVR